MILVVRRLTCVSLFILANLCYVGYAISGYVSTSVSVGYALVAGVWMWHISRSYHAPRRRLTPPL